MTELSPKPVNLANELAKERNRAAAERTLMAWIRTSLSMIGFGVGIDRIVAAVSDALGERDPIRLSRILGLAFIALGVFALIAAIIGHIRELRHLERGEYVYTSRFSLATVVAGSLIIIGAFAFFAILL